jgi:hypothetical protein
MNPRKRIAALAVSVLWSVAGCTTEQPVPGIISQGSQAAVQSTPVTGSPVALRDLSAVVGKTYTMHRSVPPAMGSKTVRFYADGKARIDLYIVQETWPKICNGEYAAKASTTPEGKIVVEHTVSPKGLEFCRERLVFNYQENALVTDNSEAFLRQ